MNDPRERARAAGVAAGASGAVRAPGAAGSPPALQGDLAAFSLWEILQWLAQWGGEGVLELSAAPGVAPIRIHCRDGVLLGIEGGEPAPRAGRLGDLLLERGLLDAPGLRALLGLQRRARSDRGAAPAIGTLALAAGLLEAEPLDEALRELARRRVLSCLARREGSFALRLGPPARPGLDVGEPIASFLLHAAQACDASGTGDDGPGFA